MAAESGLQNKTEEVSLKEILLRLQKWVRFLLHQWRWMVLFAVIGCAAGLIIAFLTKPVYTATVTFVTETKEGASPMSAYAGLASQFGINLGGGASDDLFNGDNIFDLMKTRLILQKTLLTPLTYKNKQILFIDRYIVINRLLRKNPSWKNVSFNPPLKDSSRLREIQNGIIKSVCGSISGDLTFKKGSIMKLSFTSKNQLFAQKFLETLILNAGEFYIATKTKKARDNVAILQKQLDSVKNQLYGAMGNVAAFQDLNPNLIREEPRVQQQKSSLKVSTNSAIYQQLVTGLEAAKMTLQKETPLFEIIDEPVLPLDEKSPNKVKLGIVGALLGLFLSGGWLLMRKIYKEIMAGEE